MALYARLCLFFTFITFALSKVVVHRCCPFNVTLDSSLNCKGVETEEWAPAVYIPEKKTFLVPGTLPDDWTFQVKRPDCHHPKFMSSNSTPPKYVTFLNGSLLIIPFFKEKIHPEHYCLDKTGALVCLESDEVLIPKCCGSGGAYSEKKASCVHSTVEHQVFKDLRTIHKFPECSDPGLNFVIGGKLNSTFWLKEDGNLTDDSGKTMTSDEFCLEKIEEYPEEPVHVFTCPPKLISRSQNDIRFTLYPMGLFLSVFFLAITLVASCLLPSTYHVLHWRCQTNHVACLLIGDLLLAVTQLSGDALQGPACVFVAIGMHFIFLAAFFWLNTMCFNIWWTFRDLRPASLDKGQEACRLRIYELYAWGGPLVIAGIGAVFDHLPDTDNGPNFIKPRFGEHRCWFYGDAELLYYFFGPIGVLLLLNLTLFAATARELTCGLWKTEVVKSNTERATLGRVCLKLVVVMGITWVADVVSWAAGGPNYVWYFTDLINALQGVLIFAVVGCQPQVWAAMKRMWCLSNSPNDNHNVRSSSSHALPSLNDQNTSITNSSMTKPAETLC